jgi:hypothetical protein
MERKSETRGPTIRAKGQKIHKDEVVPEDAAGSKSQGMQLKENNSTMYKILTKKLADSKTKNAEQSQMAKDDTVRIVVNKNQCKDEEMLEDEQSVKTGANDEFDCTQYGPGEMKTSRG